MKRAPTRRSWAERAIPNLAFLLLFPGFFFYHTALGIGSMGAFLGGYFAPVSLLFVLPLCLVYGYQLKTDIHSLSRVDLHFGIFLAYFLAVMAINAAAGANVAIGVGHLLGILFLVNIFILFKTIDFAHREFRRLAIPSLLAMSAIVFAYSVDGVFYLGALGIAKDAESLATYQGFSRSYLVTFMAVIAYTRGMALRALLYCLAGAALFLNTARSEFAALLFVIPIIEFYHARQKLFFILALVSIVSLINLNLDPIVAALPNNRILELLDLSQSSSANTRHHLSVHAMQTIAAHPLLGAYASYSPGNYSHNILSAWVDLGLFGLIYLLAIIIIPAIPMFFREYLAARRSGTFLLGFSLACITVLLLLTSHYFTDMLIGATLGAYSQYRHGRKLP
jgi:hypothetical protein